MARSKRSPRPNDIAARRVLRQRGVIAAACSGMEPTCGCFNVESPSLHPFTQKYRCIDSLTFEFEALRNGISPARVTLRDTPQPYWRRRSAEIARAP